MPRQREVLINELRAETQYTESVVSPTQQLRHGALVISLDFELHWGVRDKVTVDGPYRPNMLGARLAIPRILSLFREFGISATWATVGFLFARNRDELMDFSPVERPQYKNARLNPYDETIGRNEVEDPLHFGRSLLQTIQQTERQEIGSHTFSHYYCLEAGHNAGSFRADLRSAQNIAATLGINLRSLVLPRNQFNPKYSEVIRDAGFICYRGNQRGSIYAAADDRGGTSSFKRAARLADSYIPLSSDRQPNWTELSAAAPLYDVPASRFLRPWHPRLSVLDPMLVHRIKRGMQHAARDARIYHVWWHPHNFGLHIDESMRLLSLVLTEFRKLRDKFGFVSMSMTEAAEFAAVLQGREPVGTGQA